MINLENRKEFLKLIADLRKNGVEFVKSGDFELRLAPTALFPESNYKRKKAAGGEDIKTMPPFSDEDALYWSSTSVEGLQQ